MCQLWEAGDKALCVWKNDYKDGLEVGTVYTVTEVVPPQALGLPPSTPYVGLVLKEFPEGEFCPDCGEVHPHAWYSDRFRRIKPDAKKAGRECKQLLDLFTKQPELV
jgi:hypothetical protein